MAPTLVLRGGRVLLVLGSPGGSRIPSIVLETILNVADFGMRPQAAVDAPRIHHQWLPDVIFHEPFALSPDTIALLKGLGYTLTAQSPWGAAQLIEIAPPEGEGAGPASSGNDAALSGALAPGLVYGATDPRRPAGAAAAE